MATILLVDDDPDVRIVLEKTLATAGHAVISAANGIAALDIIEHESLDLMLTDVIMPGLNGFNLARMARTRAPFLKIVYLTGYYEQAIAMRDHGDKLGKLLTKPILPDELTREIDQVLSEELHA